MAKRVDGKKELCGPDVTKVLKLVVIFLGL